MGKKGAALSTEEEAMLGPSTPDQKLDELIESQRSKLTAMRESLQDELGAVEQFEDVVGDVRMFRFLRGFKVRGRRRGAVAAGPSHVPPLSAVRCGGSNRIHAQDAHLAQGKQH